MKICTREKKKQNEKKDGKKPGGKTTTRHREVSSSLGRLEGQQPRPPLLPPSPKYVSFFFTESCFGLESMII